MFLVLATNLSADFVAHGQLGFESESPAAHLVCRECDFDQRDDPPRAFSFLNELSGNKRRRGRAPCCVALQLQDVLDTMDELKELTGAARNRLMTETGVRKQTSPLHPDALPGFDLTTMRPQDVTHLEGCGLGRREAGSMLHHFIVKKKKFTLAQFERARRRWTRTLARARARAHPPASQCVCHSSSPCSASHHRGGSAAW